MGRAEIKVSMPSTQNRTGTRRTHPDRAPRALQSRRCKQSPLRQVARRGNVSIRFSAGVIAAADSLFIALASFLRSKSVGIPEMVVIVLRPLRC